MDDYKHLHKKGALPSDAVAQIEQWQLPASPYEKLPTVQETMVNAEEVIRNKIKVTFVNAAGGNLELEVGKERVGDLLIPVTGHDDDTFIAMHRIIAAGSHVWVGEVCYQIYQKVDIYDRKDERSDNVLKYWLCVLRLVDQDRDQPKQGCGR